MNGLQHIQQRFCAAIDHAGEPGCVAALADDLVQGPGLNDAARIAIYQNNTRATCHNALMQIYPVCLAVVGERCFHTLARDYIHAHPSRHPDLNQYGGSFDRVLHAVLRRPGYEGLAYLPTLARLEWCRHAIYYAADDAPFDAETFARDAAADADGIRLRPSAALRLLDADFPVLTLWQRHLDGAGTDVIPARAERVVLWRDGFQPCAERVAAADFALLRAVCDGLTLGQMTGVGLAVDRLGGFITRGWVVGHQRLPDAPMVDR